MLSCTIFVLTSYSLYTQAWYEEGSEVLSFKSGPPSNLGPPVIEGSKITPFSLNIMVCRRFQPPFRQPPIWPFPPFYIFSKTPLLVSLFWQCCPNEIPDKQKNSSFLEDLKPMLNAFFINNTFIVTPDWHLIWNNNKHSEGKTCWVKGITITKSMHYWWKTVLTPLYKHPPCMGYPLFWKKILIPPSMIFQKSQAPIIKGGLHHKYYI